MPELEISIEEIAAVAKAAVRGSILTDSSEEIARTLLAARKAYEALDEALTVANQMHTDAAVTEQDRAVVAAAGAYAEAEAEFFQTLLSFTQKATAEAGSGILSLLAGDPDLGGLLPSELS